MRLEVEPTEMERRFDRGTSFRVANIDVKDERVELKLESGSGDPAKLKLTLGAASSRGVCQDRPNVAKLQECIFATLEVVSWRSEAV